MSLQNKSRLKSIAHSLTFIGSNKTIIKTDNIKSKKNVGKNSLKLRTNVTPYKLKIEEFAQHGA